MLVEIINAHYEKLNDSDMQSLSMIMDNPAQIAGMSIEEVAKKCNTSKSSVLRLTQKLGFSGFSEFKSCLKWENQNKMINHQDAFESIRKDFMTTCQHLEASSHLEKIAQRIHTAQNVVLYGTGQAQRYCAMEMQRLFMEANKYIYYVGASDEFRMLSKNLGVDDLVIILSLSGNISKIKDTLQLLKVKEVKMASITNLQNNPLSAMCDYHLYAVSSPLKLAENLEHNSFMNFLAVIEYIFLTYLKYAID